MTRNAKLRQICRNYLQRLRHMADKHGLTSWLDQAIKDTKHKDCEPTEHECQMLARLVNDERVTRAQIPHLLNKPQRQCGDDDDYDKLPKLRRLGIYDKVGTLLYAEKIKKKLKKA